MQKNHEINILLSLRLFNSTYNYRFAEDARINFLFRFSSQPYFRIEM